VGQEIEIQVDHGADQVPAVQSGFENFCLCGFHTFVNRLQDTCVERFLAAEIGVDHAFVDPGQGGDLIDTCSVEPLAGKFCFGSHKDVQA